MRDIVIVVLVINPHEMMWGREGSGGTEMMIAGGEVMSSLLSKGAMRGGGVRGWLSLLSSSRVGDDVGKRRGRG